MRRVGRGGPLGQVEELGGGLGLDFSSSAARPPARRPRLRPLLGDAGQPLARGGTTSGKRDESRLAPSAGRDRGSESPDLGRGLASRLPRPSRSASARARPSRARDRSPRGLRARPPGREPARAAEPGAPASRPTSQPARRIGLLPRQGLAAGAGPIPDDSTRGSSDHRPIGVWPGRCDRPAGWTGRSRRSVAQCRPRRSDGPAPRRTSIAAERSRPTMVVSRPRIPTVLRPGPGARPGLGPGEPPAGAACGPAAATARANRSWPPARSWSATTRGPRSRSRWMPSTYLDYKGGGCWRRSPRSSRPVGSTHSHRHVRRARPGRRLQARPGQRAAAPLPDDDRLARAPTARAGRRSSSSRRPPTRSPSTGSSQQSSARLHEPGSS